MDERLKADVLALLDAARAELKAGNTEAADAKITEAKDKIEPLPGTGTNGKPIEPVD